MKMELGAWRDSTNLQPTSAYWPFGVICCVLRGLFQQRDVDQSTGQNEQHRQRVCPPAENEQHKDSSIPQIKLQNVVKATGASNIWKCNNTMI